MSTVWRYANTIRYLKPVQIYGRIWTRIVQPRPDLRPAPPVRKTAAAWTPPVFRSPSQTGPAEFRFLNVERTASAPGDWANSRWEKLWLYNLHYFEDLNALENRRRREWHERLIERWIVENPPAKAPGWEPYPLSLRVVNWIKWLLSGNEPPAGMIHSLAVQVRYLARRLEFHLLGNHLIANAKALIFAGLYFRGKEADAWLDRGMSVLTQELGEQILSDGGHFERSPMYHSLVLEDLLDLLNLERAFSEAVCARWHRAAESWAELAKKMRAWLKVMTHPDGEIALFNDSAFGIALKPAILEDYAEVLDLPPASKLADDVTYLRDSGYLRLQAGPAVALLDAAPLGPDYLPAHGHADTLSFEISIRGERVIVDSGTSTYETGPERQRQRGTAAHNTVRLDGADSSEVWGAFRVAKRAQPENVRVARTEDEIRVSACHDGYERLRGAPRHCREWALTEGGLRITDSIGGKGEHLIELFYHVHPRVSAEAQQSNRMVLSTEGQQIAALEIDRALEVGISDTTFHAEFGSSVASKKVVASAVRSLPQRLTTNFSWSTSHPAR